RHQTTAAGIAVIGQKYVGWGTAFIDFDLDGWEDLFISNGHVHRLAMGEGASHLQRAVFLLNRGDSHFRPATRLLGSYGARAHAGRGVGFVDLDNDGRVDMVISHVNEPV